MTLLDAFSLFEDKTLIIVYVSGALTVLYLALELLGVFHGKHTSPLLNWFQGQEKALHLAIVICILSLCLKIYKTQKRLADKTESIETITQKIDGKVGLLQELKNVKKGLDPLLDSMFSADMDDKIMFMENALHQKRYEVRDVNKFYQAYAKVLLVLPKAQILSTSILDSSYFWSAQGEPFTVLETKMKNFISSGGKMKRIFYIGENSLNNARNLAVLARQKEIGVDVFTINKATTNKQLFVLFDKSNFAWQVQVDPDDKHITKFVFTRNDEDVKQIEDEFSKLMNNATCTPYN